MRPRVVVVLCALAILLAVPTVLPTVRGLTWTQTSEADFLAGQRSNLDVLASGDLQLASSLSAWSRAGVVLDLGPPGSYDADGARNPFVMKDGTTYRMWYTGFDGGSNRLLYATSADGVTWTRRGLAINVGTPPYNFDSVVAPSVIKDGATYKMWFHGGFTSGGPAGLWGQIYYATSNDAAAWTIIGPALTIGPGGAWDDSMLHFPSVVRDGTGRYWMYYVGWDGTPGGWGTRIGLATSTSGSVFARTGTDPVLLLGPIGSWDDATLTMPSVLDSSPMQMWYSGSDGFFWQIGLASSADRFNWTKDSGNPLFVLGPPGSWDDTRVWGPSLLVDGSNTLMYYTGYDGTNNRVGLARQGPGFVLSGSFESAILDSGGGGTTWNTLSSTATVAAGTQVLLSARSGTVPTPDASWSPWSPAMPPGTSPIVSPRARYLQVRAVLSTTNGTVSPTLHEFMVSYEPDQVSAPVPLSPVGGAWVNTSGLRLEWTFTDPEADSQRGFQVQLSSAPSFSTIEQDSGVVLSANRIWLAPPVPDGSWYWRVRTLDAYDVWSAFSTPESVRVDTTQPVTFVGFASLPDVVDGLPLLESGNAIVLTASDAGSGVAQTLIGVNLRPPSPYTGPFLPSDHGPVILTFGSTDVAGNAEDWTFSMVLIDDRPTVSVVSPSAGAWLNASMVTVGWAFNDPEGDAQSEYETQVSTDPLFGTVEQTSGVMSSASSSHIFRGLADGTHNVRVRAADQFGAWSPFGPVRSFSVDTFPPTAVHQWSRTEGAIGGRTWILPGATLSLTASDGGSGVADVFVSIDGVVSDYAGPATLSAHGVHVVEYWAEDRAGNAGARTRLDVLVDQPPAAVNQGPSSAGWVALPLQLSWGYSDSDGDLAASYEVQVSSDASFSPGSLVATGAAESTATLWESPSISHGAYFWRVRVEDEYGVWSTWSTPTPVRVDAIAPVVSAIHNAELVADSYAAVLVGETIALNATDEGSGVAEIRFSLDGGSWTVYSGPFALDPGRHVLVFQASDVVGNEGSPRVLVVDSIFPMNWTPVIASLLGIVLALAGALVASRVRRGRRSGERALAWGILAGPAVVVEFVVAAYSALTGALATPPWVGQGLVVMLVVAIGGVVSIAVGAKGLSQNAQPPRPPSEEPRQHENQE